MSHKENIQEILKGCGKGYWCGERAICFNCYDKIEIYLKAVKVELEFLEDSTTIDSFRTAGYMIEYRRKRIDCEKTIELGEKE